MAALVTIVRQGGGRGDSILASPSWSVWESWRLQDPSQFDRVEPRPSRNRGPLDRLMRQDYIRRNRFRNRFRPEYDGSWQIRAQPSGRPDEQDTEGAPDV